MNRLIKYIGIKIGRFMEKSRFFNRNTTPKIVSVIFALVMWLYVMGEVNPESIIELSNVHVQLINVEQLQQSGLVIDGQKSFTVNVKVSGRRNDLYKIRSKDIEVIADLRGLREGVNSVHLEVNGPGNIRIEDVSPEEIKIRLDEIVRVEKPVVVKGVGNPTDGFEPGDAMVSPNKVMVEGPKSLVRTVTAVLADINVENLHQDVKERVLLKPINKRGKVVKGVSLETKYADVTLPILRTKQVPIFAKYSGNPKEGYKVTYSAITPKIVKIKGPKESLEKIGEIKTKNINIEGLDQSKEERVQLDLPSGIYVSSKDKNVKVFVQVERIKTKEFTFQREEIIIDNLESLYSIDLNKVPDTIKVTIDAVESMINRINKGDIQLHINTRDLKEGIYSTNIQYQLPYEVEDIIISPRKVDFEIKDKNEPESNE